MKIAIASGKGGTGKTFLATNLASYIAQKEDVVLTDLDVEEPNAAFFTKGSTIHSGTICKFIPKWLPDKCTFCNTCQDVCNFHAILRIGEQVLVFPELCHGCFACSELCQEGALPMISQKMGTLHHSRDGRLSFVEGRLDIGEEQAPPLIRHTQKYIDEHFAHIIRIFDCPPGNSCSVIEATHNVDLVVLVTDPTPFGLHDLKLIVQTMQLLEKPFCVVINRYKAGNDIVSNFCKENRIQVAATIPDNPLIAKIYSKGELVYPAMPEVQDQLKKVYYFLKTLVVQDSP